MLNEYNIPIDMHTIRATDMILGWVAAVKDRDSRQLIKHAERTRNAKSSVFKPLDVYALLRIVDQVETNMSVEGSLIAKTVECVLDLIFQLPTSDEDGEGIDVQAWADGLLEWVKLHLQPRRDDNPLGYVPSYAQTPPSVMPFGWSTDKNFRAKLTRGVIRMDGKPADLSGTYYCIPYQFKIDVYTSAPLT